MTQSTRKSPERIAEVNHHGVEVFLVNSHRVSYGCGKAYLLDLKTCLVLDIPLDRSHWQVTSPIRVQDTDVYEAVEKRLHTLLDLPTDATVVYIDFIDSESVATLKGSMPTEYPAAHILVVSASFPKINVYDSYPMCTSLHKLAQEKQRSANDGHNSQST